MNAAGREAVRVVVLGGSGLYALAGLDEGETVEVATPFGKPSDAIRIGRLGDQRVGFLARHGRDHTLLPGEINYRANVYALKLLGVERVLSASAVGSLRETIHPRDVVVVDQIVDRTRHRAETFFGEGVVAHVSLADPVCPTLRERLVAACAAQGATHHPAGSYLCIEGPAFSTRAESRLYRSWGLDVIGMTNATEARLCREAEICYATLALVTDYDCWHDEMDDVSVSGLLENLRVNSETAARVLRHTIEALGACSGEPRACPCANALEHALITPRRAMPGATLERLKPLLGRHLG